MSELAGKQSSQGEPALEPSGIPTAMHPWLLPGVLGAAAFVAFVFPERGLSVLLALTALGICPLAPALPRKSPVAIVRMVRAWATELMVDILSPALVQVLSAGETQNAMVGLVHTMAGNEAMRTAWQQAMVEVLQDKSLHATLLETISKVTLEAVTNEEFKKVMTEAVSICLLDDNLHRQLLGTASKFIVAAIEDRELNDAVLKCVVHIAQEDDLHKEALAMVSKGLILASADETLRESMMSLIKKSVGDALNDETFMNAFRDSLCDSLKDSNMYRAAARGVVGSLNPFSKHSNTNQL